MYIRIAGPPAPTHFHRQLLSINDPETAQKNEGMLAKRNSVDGQYHMSFIIPKGSPLNSSR